MNNMMEIKCPKCGTKFNVRIFIEYKEPPQGYSPY